MRVRMITLLALAVTMVLVVAPRMAADTATGSATRLVSGLLKSVESKPNVPGARCGYHYELVVASSEGPVRVIVYDHNAPIERLDDLVDQVIEVQLDGNVARSVSRAGVKPEPNDKLVNLGVLRQC